jgi:hypothetical protein
MSAIFEETQREGYFPHNFDLDMIMEAAESVMR